jgi:hypothetical protein
LFDAVDHALPAAGLDQAEEGDEEGAKPDEHELEDFIENGGEESAEADIDSDGDGGENDAEVDVPAEDDLHDLGHGVHVDAAHEDGHEGEGDGGKRAGGGTEAEQEVAGDRVGLADVVERHHDEAEEDHGGDGADPVPVGGHDAVLVGVARPAEQFERAEIGGDEGEAGDPGGHFAAGHEETLRRCWA